MPQLTLSFASPTKSLSLSQSSPSGSHSGSKYRRSASGPGTGTGTAARIAAYHSSSPNNLWKLHHEEEDMAAQDKARRKMKEEGKEVHMHEDEAEPNGEGRAKGNPGGMGKRSRSPEGGGVAGREAKRHKNAYEIKGKVATAEDAARVDADPPLDALMKLQNEKKAKGSTGESVVYWMRMNDLRIEDNTALALASAKAQELGVPLIWLFVLSPGDYKWHDRSPNRLDFMLRNLRHLKPEFEELNIPLTIRSYDRRLAIPRKLVTEVFPELGANHVFANIEYEVDELRRDIATIKLGREKGVDVVAVHDRLVVPPGKILSKQGKPMSVFSPWQRQWAKVIEAEPELLEISPKPQPNDAAIRQHPTFSKLFAESQIPDHIEGFRPDDPEQMKISWPEGLHRARELLDRFLHTKARKKLLQLVSPLEDGAEQDEKQSRINTYQTGRNLVDGDNSSRLSPYLTSGVISGRMVIQAAKKMGKGGKLESGRDTGVGMWIQEVSWRDFYSHILAIWPRVSMGRPFLEKFADVQWEVSEEYLQAWKDGKTGYPIVDAAMRACKARGWMENRVRMVTASFLVKELMLDWRLGEKYFMESFIDGDLAANNGGWQWVASTGTDPQPYFRIFNMLSQSEKCDPNGDYIRYWVPELRNLKGKAIHDPFGKMPLGEFKKLGYPAPIVEHKMARERALFRYKNVGEKEDGS